LPPKVRSIAPYIYTRSPTQHPFRKQIVPHPIPGAICGQFSDARSGKSAGGKIGWLFSRESDRQKENTIAHIQPLNFTEKSRSHHALWLCRQSLCNEHR
jgi:hypothetical protein